MESVINSLVISFSKQVVVSIREYGIKKLAQDIDDAHQQGLATVDALEKSLSQLYDEAFKNLPKHTPVHHTSVSSVTQPNVTLNGATEAKTKGDYLVDDKGKYIICQAVQKKSGSPCSHKAKSWVEGKAYCGVHNRGATPKQADPNHRPTTNAPRPSTTSFSSVVASDEYGSLTLDTNIGSVTD